ncbi:MAG: hypothetical protein GC192_05845 [Bacteroidetes bacterium]|nr:hypothetical protein [Bacteroidota bacterium]
MKIIVKEGHIGVMTLRDGTQMNYGMKRITRNFTKLIYYTDKGIHEMLRPDMNEEEKAKAMELKKMDEKALRKLGYVAEVALLGLRTFS